MSFQTRSDINGITHHNTLAHAYNAWLADKTIWKISYEDENGERHRMRPKYKKEMWSYESENEFVQFSKAYQKASDNELFWVDQPTFANEKGFVNKAIYTAEEFKEIVYGKDKKKTQQKKKSSVSPKPSQNYYAVLGQ